MELIPCRAFELGRPINYATSAIHLDEILVKETEGKGCLPRKVVTVGVIKEALKGSVGVDLPKSLVQDFGLDSALWMMPYSRQAITALFLGFAERTPDLNLQTAGTVIEFTSTGHTVKKGSSVLDLEKVIVPKRLCLSGNLMDEQGNIRAVGLDYDFDREKNELNLWSARVSVANVDFPRPDTRFLRYADCEHEFGGMEKIPSDLGPMSMNKHLIGGLITDEMVRQTKFGEVVHPRTVNIRNRRDGYLETFFKSNSGYPNPGYRIEVRDGIGTLSFIQDKSSYKEYYKQWLDSSEKPSDPWQVSFPTLLPWTPK